MPVLTVSGLGLRDYKPNDLLRLESNLKSVIVSDPVLGLRAEQITVHFPIDLIGATFEAGAERYQRDVIISITCLFDRPERTPEVRRALAESVQREVRHFVEEVGGFTAHGAIECFVHPFNLSDGYAG